MLIRTLKSRKSMKRYGRQVWALLVQAYSKVEGGLNYPSLKDLVQSSAEWKVVLLNNQVVAVTVYKAKKGFKLVAMAASPSKKEEGRQGLIDIISHDLSHRWMELSDAAESFVMKRCGGDRYLISNELANELLEREVLPADTNYHYFREIQKVKKKKVLLGTVCV